MHEYKSPEFLMLTQALFLILLILSLFIISCLMRAIKDTLPKKSWVLFYIKLSTWTGLMQMLSLRKWTSIRMEGSALVSYCVVCFIRLLCCLLWQVTVLSALLGYCVVCFDRLKCCLLWQVTVLSALLGYSVVCFGRLHCCLL